MNTLNNDLLSVAIKTEGAELCSINSIKNNIEFIWQANPDIWGSHAPNLFPIIGVMKDNCYIYNGKTFPMTKHGFVRNNKNFTLTKTSATELSFQLTSDAELRKMYPFLFEFVISYQLTDNILTINHKINNLDDKPIYFSVGGHPAFNCPIYPNENYTNYSLEFEKAEHSESHLLNTNNGLVTSVTKPVFNDAHNIKLNGKLFNEDALIFKDIKSRKVTLKHNNKGPVLSVSFKDFPFLGIWAKPNAPYVCIEPWLGIADSETTNQKIESKEGIKRLDIGETFEASYSIEIAKTHLV